MLDAYDRAFIDAKKRQTGSPDDADFQEKVMLRGIELFEKAQIQHPRLVRAFVEGPAIDDLQLPLLEFVERTRFYQDVLGEYDPHLAETEKSGKPDPRHNWRTAAFTFAPWFLQEIEGPVRRGLLLIGWMMTLENQRAPKGWEAYVGGHPYISGAIKGVSASAQPTDPWFSVVDGLDPKDNPVRIGLLRNAMGHNDYLVSGTSLSGGHITFRNKGNGLVLSAQDFFGLFTATQDLTGLFNVIVHLGLRRWTGQPPMGTPPPKAPSSG